MPGPHTKDDSLFCRMRFVQGSQVPALSKFTTKTGERHQMTFERTRCMDS